ncbi:MAG TPA: protein kinase [Pyrinomonadaceae bacterium]|nr:protein kinase [Pyrinomonadaceae bacterium]
MTCPRCQSFVKDGLQFCTNCGERLADSRPLAAEPEDASDGRAVSRGGRGEDATIVEPDALLGRVLDAKYELTGRLGEGGMGAVYRARRVHIGDEVAVKVLHPKYLEDSAAVERFRREARAAAQLHHTNVVTIHDYGETVSGGEKFAYIVMELVTGLSLRTILKREKRLAAGRAVQLMRDVCAGVGAAHRRQIVHRDIKPDNIIVIAPDEDHERETVKVVDFGIAKLRDLAVDSATLTQTGMVVGTPYYMSPEQCRGDSLDARSDVYSLGALLYEMLAGAPPFTAPTVTGVIAKHLTESPPRLPSTVEPRPAIESAVVRALAKDPEARQRDAAEFARELSAAMDAPAAPADAGKDYNSPAAMNPNVYARTHVPPPHAAASPPSWPAPRPVTPTPANEYAGRQHEGAQRQPAPPVYYPQQGAGAAQPHAGTHPGQPQPRRKSRAPLVVLVVLLLVAASGAVLLAVMLANNRQTPRREANTPAPRGTSANTGAATNTANANTANVNQRLNDRIAVAESKIVAGAPLSESDLNELTPQELRLLRNTVYARHGRQFTSGDLQQHFAARTWYKPRPGYTDDVLDEADQRNLALIQEREGGGGETATADPAAARKEISDALESWAESTGDRDLDQHMSHYAPTLDTYYNARAIPSGQVRADRAKAFGRYDEMRVELRNIAVTTDPSGARATVVFDKHWRFEGTQCSEGTVKQMLSLARATGGRWLITGEKDLYVYPDRNDDCD